MTETFTASNGWTVDDRGLRGSGGVALMAGRNGPVFTAIRECVMHELGVWQDPETGYLVVRAPYADDSDGRAVVVLTGSGHQLCWEGLSDAGTSGAPGVAARYFAAHPKSAPWVGDAKPGDAWVLTVDGEEMAATIDDDGDYHLSNGGWIYANNPGDRDRITDGRCIYRKGETE